MDVLESEFDGSWPRFFLSIPLDVITFLFVFTVSGVLIMHYVETRKKTGFRIQVILSTAVFSIYYLAIRDILLNYLLGSIVYFACLSVTFMLSPLVLRQNKNQAFRFLKLNTSDLARRVLGRAFALIVFILLLPLFIVIPIIIKLTSPGPIFVRHLAISRAGRPVYLFNFRTRNSYASSYETPAFLLTSLTDPEITLFGRFLQKSGLHALPRLWSVIKGDLYLIGVSPLDRQKMLSDFTKVLLETEYAKVQAMYSVSDREAFSTTVEQCLPLGLITYAELYAYHVRPWQRVLIKDINVRGRLMREADYFILTRYASIRLFARLLAKVFFRLLNSINLAKLVEAEGPPHDSTVKEEN
jgi:lipopolysaccharide/colanic/teichoic acid biosynthesis glycosyltransferase